MRSAPMKGRVVRVSHQSLCLSDNPLGDPHERDLYVYLPPQYDGKQRFRVVMMLAGFGSTNHSIAGWSPWKPNTIELFDQLIAEERCKPAILLLPDCFNRWGGSQFIDSAGTGRYQTYLADEVFPFVDAEFQTIPKREARAVVGRSSGGFGALRLGMDRPDAVSVIGSHAGDAAFEVSMRPMLNVCRGDSGIWPEECVPVRRDLRARRRRRLFARHRRLSLCPDSGGPVDR
jgi:enterochelin esterase-like enzyme